jgi:hypothetical protein
MKRRSRSAKPSSSGAGEEEVTVRGVIWETKSICSDRRCAGPRLRREPQAATRDRDRPFEVAEGSSTRSSRGDP